MWLLVRASEQGSDPRELASCPDTPTSSGDAEPWQWTMHLHPDGSVAVATDAALVRACRTVHSGDSVLRISRAAGTILGLVPAAGTWEVTVLGGPWRRLLAPGDLLIAEDDRQEEIEVVGSADGAVPTINVIQIEAVDPAAQLRWIP